MRTVNDYVFMSPELKGYARKRIEESGITMVPGHSPTFKSKEDVDNWIADCEKITECFRREETNLKRCPFCGSKNVGFTDLGQPGEFEDWDIECRDCGAVVITPGKEEGCVTTKEEAATFWNRRERSRNEERKERSLRAGDDIHRQL